jgi:predicted nucleotide-binding protein
MAAIEELGSAGKPLLKDLEADKSGSFFYESSASRVLGALKAAHALTQRYNGRAAAPSVQRAPATAPEHQSTTVFVVHGPDDAVLQVLLSKRLARCARLPQY